MRSRRTPRAPWSQDKPFNDDDLGAVPPDGADLEVEPPDADSHLPRLAEEFRLLADDADLDLFQPAKQPPATPRPFPRTTIHQSFVILLPGSPPV